MKRDWVARHADEGIGQFERLLAGETPLGTDLIPEGVYDLTIVRVTPWRDETEAVLLDGRVDAVVGSVAPTECGTSPHLGMLWFRGYRSETHAQIQTKLLCNLFGGVDGLTETVAVYGKGGNLPLEKLVWLLTDRRIRAEIVANEYNGVVRNQIRYAHASLIAEPAVMEAGF